MADWDNDGMHNYSARTLSALCTKYFTFFAQIPALALQIDFLIHSLETILQFLHRLLFRNFTTRY